MHTRLTDLLDIDVPIVQAPMAGSGGIDLAVAACDAGALGSLPTARLSPDDLDQQLADMRTRTSRPYNVNFFCHELPPPDDERFAAWTARLAPYYAELGLDGGDIAPGAGRAPFGDAMCEVVEAHRPPVVSFHFGLPVEKLVDRVRATGATILSTATSVAEARWLEDHGCDVVIVQGAEAGGHQGMFLATDPSTRVGTIALVPQVVDAVAVPVIAAGGIADARGVLAALVLGAGAAQLGTAFLRCPEALTGPLHRHALAESSDESTAITNVISGRPARSIVTRLVREVGPVSADAPAYPAAMPAVTPLRVAAEAAGSSDFSSLWSGQAAPLAGALPAAELVRSLAASVDEMVARLGS